MNALLEREIRPTNVFVFLPQHKNSLAELLNSMHGSMQRKNGWNPAVVGKRKRFDCHYLQRKSLWMQPWQAKPPKIFSMTPGEVLEVCRISNNPQPRLPCKASRVELGWRYSRWVHTQREQQGYGQRRQAQLHLHLNIWARVLIPFCKWQSSTSEQISSSYYERYYPRCKCISNQERM